MEANDRIKRGYHCKWQIHYHIVFPLKYRIKRGSYRVTSIGISERYAIEIEGLGMDLDQVNLLCGAHPKMSIGEIVRIYKSITAREIFRRRPEVKKELWGGEF